MRGPIRTIMLTALAVCAFGALSVGTASATEVLPANTAFTASLAAGPTGTLSVFVPTNAFSETGVGCTESAITGTVPTAVAGTLLNQNKPEVGTHSTGYGSVSMGIVPSFKKCAIYAWTGSPAKWVKVEPEIPVEVTVTTGWTLAAFRNATSAAYTAAGVPAGGATIKYTVSGAPCELKVSPGVATAVFDEWTNGTATTASKDRVDGQIPFTAVGAACSGSSPAQFEATYSVVKNGTSEGIRIEP